jgi:hypothetical protein
MPAPLTIVVADTRQSVFDYCKGHGLVQTRSRAYKKNDQAWVEQTNGAVVRRLVGYGRLSSGAVARMPLVLADTWAYAQTLRGHSHHSAQAGGHQEAGVRRAFDAPTTAPQGA